MTAPLEGNRAPDARSSKRCAAWVVALAVLLSAGCGAQNTDPTPYRPVTPGGGDATVDDDADTTGSTDAGADGDAGVDATSSGCTSQEPMCTDGTRATCDGGEHTRTHTCAAGCEAHECTGDSCQAALVVDLAAVDKVVVEGDQWAYTNQWNAEGFEGCSLYEGESAGPTAGPELFFRLTGHQPGDVVVFDAEEGGSSFAFYVLGGCQWSRCLDSGVHDDMDNRYSWQASSNEDVWVVAEVFGPTHDRPFRIVINR